MLRQDIIRHFVDKPIRRNLNWIDGKAIQWLKLHRNDIVIVDCDKGLGDAIMPRTWINQELQRLLDSGFKKLTPNQCQQQSFLARSCIESIVNQAQARNVICTKQAEFIKVGLFSAKEGTFRLRVKLHKNPVVGRPIANLSNSWLTPASIFLCKMLAPIQEKLTYTVHSSYEFLESMPRVVPPGYEIATIDIKNLYPSIDTEHMLLTLSEDILVHYGHTDLANFVIGLLRIVLRNQLIQHRGECFQAFGIATGLPPGVFLANIYVNHVDQLVMQTHSSKIAFYARLVDDSVVCTSDVDEIQRVQNSWRHDLVWEISSRGGRSDIGEDAVAFLDIQLSHHGGSMSWETYRKPLNKYLYIPRSSAHPPAAIVSLIRGETVRIWRTNRKYTDVHKHLEFFASSMAKRGYSYQQVKNDIQKHLRKITSSSQRVTKTARKMFAVIKYSSSAEEQKRREEEEQRKKMEGGLDRILHSLTKNVSAPDITACGIDLNPARLRLLAKNLSENTSCRSIDLNRKGLTDEDGVSLATMLEKNQGLLKLECEGNNLGVQSAEKLGEALRKNQTLRSLNLESNNLTASGNDQKGIIKLAEALQENKSLRVLLLSKNGITAQAGEYFVRAIEQNDTLTLVDLSGNDASPGVEQLRRIDAVVQRNRERLSTIRRAERRERFALYNEEFRCRQHAMQIEAMRLEIEAMQERRLNRMKARSERWVEEIHEVCEDEKRKQEELVEEAALRAEANKSKGKKKRK
ncbi:NOD2 [Symbiodinium sp. CCMP2456]|nr:NOD2 [Symbiodinium sp. CCMP2456]